ncbi:hypothetical protein [Yersinia kristensenii]|uniref:hypothetical protein n=1 Tax=Yersinia kristensenii TaxID=28152 RepID=UPI0005DD0F2C|nr:hypothetical protein [Yersinia kristensenii]CFR20067.1 Uncharacterised protein [Yersinia kristensenii]
MSNRYIYHYCADFGESNATGIAQILFRIVSQEDLERLKGLIEIKFGVKPIGITSLSFLGMENE